MDDPDIACVFSGELDNLPPQESNVVRIFLSSTFTDYGEERNLLFREAIPQLRDYCQQKGLDFQVADMRWGVRDDAQADHQTTQICLNEIKNCQEVSKGPNFVALLGNRYGYRDYPSVIEAEEFETLVRAAYTVSKDPGLLEEWYKRDDNAVPASYILQPITSKFAHYNDEEEENKKLRDKDQEQWSAVNELLAMLFRDAASCAYKYGHFTFEQRQKYFTSVTEKEITEGILKSKNAINTTICFERNLEDVDTEDKIARRFVDIDAGLIDSEAQYLLNELKQNKIPRVLHKESNINFHSVRWSENGVNPDDIEHAKYLQDFKEDFIEKVGHLIYKTLEKKSNLMDNLDLYNEVLHHSHFCNTKTESFAGRDETFNRIKFKLNKVYYNEDYLSGNKKDQKYKVMMDKYLDNLPKADTEEENDKQTEKENGHIQDFLATTGVQFGDESQLIDLSADEEKVKQLVCPRMTQYSKPLIVHGPSGSGKTAMMAMVAKKSTHWFEYKPVRIIRFLGTSPQTISLRSVLTTICKQIWENYEHCKVPSMVDISKELAYLVQYFKALLMKIDTSEKPLVIVIDSVDQLNAEDYAYTMNWLPTHLPPNVYIIVSMLPEEQGILDAIKRRMPDEDRYIEVPSLPKDTAALILKMWLDKGNRTLAKEQSDILLAKFKMCPQPLFLKLSFEQAKEWHSYTSRSELTLGITTRSLIEQYFIKLEKDHGKILTRNALAYLTLGAHGISDVEMEDILSLDDEVLQDSYLYHLPPDSSSIRLPPLLWVRLKTDLADYIAQLKADGKQISRWFHRQFWEAAEKRYTGSDICSVYHSNMADYFIGKWHDRVKPLELTKKKKFSYQNCFRGVPAQPVIYANNVFNLRKMSELPTHLLKSKRYEDFISEICYSFDWLYYSCKALSVTHVLKDLSIVMHCIRADIKVLKDIEEEERKRKERERKKKSKIPDMEVGKSKVKITDITDEPEEEEVDKSKPQQNQTEVSESKTGEEDDPLTANVNGDIFQLTSQTPRTIDELLELLEEVNLVHSLLLLANDAILKDPNNLIMQILGQITTEKAVSEGLDSLRNQARAFAESCSLPLLLPSSKCLPSPGGDLVSIIDIAIGYPGDAFNLEKKVSLSEDGRYLYAVERSKSDAKQLKKGEGGDFLHVHDLANGGTQQSLEQMMGTDVKCMELVGGDKYMYLECYTQRDNFHPKYFTVVKDLSKQTPLPFTPDTTILSFSKTGRYCLLVEPYYRTDKSRQPTLANLPMSRNQSFLGDGGGDNQAEHDRATQTEASTVPTIEIAAMFDLETKQKTSLKVILGEGEGEVSDNDLKNLAVNHGIFSPDESMIVLVTGNGNVYCFLTERGKYMYKWNEENVSFGFSEKNVKNSMAILSNNYLLMPGVGYESCKKLIIRNLNNGETIKELEGHSYGISLLEVGRKENLVATATSENSVVNGNTEKDIVVWNIEKGEKFAQCKGNCGWVAMKFFGENDEYLFTASSMGSWSRVVQVWYIGTLKKPCKDALPIHNIIGHSETVLNIDISYNCRMLVTASKDNTVRLWSLDKIMEHCEKTMLISQEMGMDGLRDYICNHDDSKPRNPEEVPTVTTDFSVCKSSLSGAVSSDTGWLLFCNLADHNMVNSQKISSCISHLISTTDGKTIISAGKDQPIVVWDAKTGNKIKEIQATRKVDCMDEAQNILVAGMGGMECYGVLYDLNSGQVLKELQGLYGFSNVVITSDAKKVVTTMFEFPMIFDVTTGQPNEMEKHDIQISGCSCLVKSPCDRYVASCSTDGSVRVTEIETAKYIFRLQHKSSVVSAEFSPDSKWVATAGFRSLLIWSMKNGTLARSLSRHQDFITELGFACEGRYLVSASKDKQIIIWDFKNSKSVATFHAHCPVSKLKFTKDLSSILYVPENVAYIAVLQPNKVLKEVLKGEEKNAIPEPIVQAQAFAFTFSGQKAKVKSSAACNIL